MPRQPRLDAPGTLHHVIRRRIERTKIFRNEADKRDFLSRLAQLCEAGFWMVYACAPFVLSSSGRADGLSGSRGGTFSWGDYIGSGSCGPFGKSSRNRKISVSSPFFVPLLDFFYSLLIPTPLTFQLDTLMIDPGGGYEI